MSAVRATLIRPNFFLRPHAAAPDLSGRIITPGRTAASDREGALPKSGLELEQMNAPLRGKGVGRVGKIPEHFLVDELRSLEIVAVAIVPRCDREQPVRAFVRRLIRHGQEKLQLVDGSAGITQ